MHSPATFEADSRQGERDGRARCGFNGREIGRVTCASHFKEKDSQSFSNALALISNLRERASARVCSKLFESHDTDRTNIF